MTMELVWDIAHWGPMWNNTLHHKESLADIIEEMLNIYTLQFEFHSHLEAQPLHCLTLYISNPVSQSAPRVGKMSHIWQIYQFKKTLESWGKK